MDIQQWIQGVVADEPAGISDRDDIPELFHPKQSNAAAVGHRRKRRRSSDGTSFLEKPAAPKSPTPDNHSQSHGSHAAHSSPGQSGVSDGRYKKKPRRKTREDLYDNGQAKSKAKSKRNSGKQREEEEQQSKKKEKRRKPTIPHTTQHRNFKAKNVVTDRLTVRPH